MIEIALEKLKHPISPFIRVNGLSSEEIKLLREGICFSAELDT